MRNDIDVVSIQETHTENDEQLITTHHHAYGVATYARLTIDHAQLCKTSNNNNVHEVVVSVGDINISNMYKPPANIWTPDDLSCICKNL